MQELGLGSRLLRPVEVKDGGVMSDENTTARNESVHQSPLHECDSCAVFGIKGQSPMVRGDQPASWDI